MSRSRVEVPGGVASKLPITPTTPARAMKESELQKAVVEAALMFGWLVYHTYDSRRSQRGFPDLVMVRGQRTLFVELKSSKGRMRPEQTEWLNRLEASHQETFVWRPEDWVSGEIVRELRKQ